MFLPSILSTASANNWILISYDYNDFNEPNLRAVYYKVERGILFFKVTFHNNISTIDDFDVGIFLDVDKNPNTGFDVDHTYPGASTGIGAEYVIVIGWEAYFYSSYAVMWRNIGTSNWDIDNQVYPDYINVDFSKNMFVVGYKLHKITGLKDSARVAVTDVGPNYLPWRVWDWCPDTGNVLIKIKSTLLSVFGTSTKGLAFLTIAGDSGRLKIYTYPSLDDGISYNFKLKVVSVSETDEWMTIDILINYDMGGGDNWLPARIIVDKLNGIVYLFGPVNMIGYL